VRWKESVIVTRESSGTPLEQLFCGEKVLLVATGNVEAGVNLADVGKDDVKVNGERVIIRLPEPQILSLSLDEKETGVYERDFSFLNIRAEDSIRSFVTAFGFTKVEFVD
jgi:Protein of unknown function (DUF4230)